MQTPSTSTFNTSDGVTMNQPLPPDTFIHYKNTLTDVYAFIMNQNPPVYRNGYWHYELYTSQGVELQMCSEEHMTVVIDHLPNQQNKPTPTPSINPPVVQTPPRVSSSASVQQHQQHNTSSYSLQYQRICNQRQQQQPSTSFNPSHCRKWTSGTTENDFEYPIGTTPKSIWADALLKHSAKWDLDKVKGVDDLPGLWHTLQVRLEAYNIFLKKYISKEI